MAKNAYLKIYIFLFLSLLTFIKSQDQWLHFIRGKGFTDGTKDHSPVTSYAVDFCIDEKCEESYNGPLYLKIEITSEEGKQSPLVCYSSTQSDCDEREILLKSLNGNKVYFWVKREQFQEQGTEPYFVVTCPGEANCKYSIVGSDSDNNYAAFGTNFVYSYSVTSKNKNMKFHLMNETAFDNSYRFALCMEGSSTAKLKLDSSYDSYDIGTLHCYNYVYSDYVTDWGGFSITDATEGDYITISSHYYTSTGDEINLGRAAGGFATINGPRVTGIITGQTTEECFPITKPEFDKASEYLYIEGKIHSKYAWFFLEDENGNFIESTDTEVINGQLSFVYRNENKFRYICFERPNDETFTQGQVLFSFQIIDYGKLADKSFTFSEPMISGQFYRKLLPKGKIDYYHVGTLDNAAKKYDFTLNNIKGIAKLYMDETKTFPFVKYEEKDLADLNALRVSNANNHMIYSSETCYEAPIDSEKYLMVVYCDKTELNSDYCEFDLSVFSKGQDIDLIENQKLYKYVLKGEKGNLLVNLQQNRIFTRATIDIMIFNGDVSFSIKEKELKSQQIYLSNKVTFYVDMQNDPINLITIEFEANLNSFFDIQYTIDPINKEQTQEILYSGESYLVQVNPLSTTKTKTVKMGNMFGNKSPFMTNFFELNCEFEVKRGDKSIIFSDGYAQDNLNKGELVDNYYTYNIKITQQDSSNYNNKMCLLYVAGYELGYQVDKTIDREIIVAENINQQIIFEKNFKKIRFTYPIVDTSKDLTYHVNVIDKANYKINGYFNGQLYIENVSVAVTSTYYIINWDIDYFCKSVQLCSFSLDVEVEGEIVQTNPMIEITFREIKNVPTYLQKGNTKLDYVCGDKLYYLYTDLGRNDVAEITLNFLREFGQLYAKVVKKDLQKAEPEANWRKYYRMPGPDWEDSLPFDSYSKKMKITTKDTEECLNGCYLLMTVKTNDIGDYVPDNLFYQFSIVVKVSPPNKAYTEIPKLVIQVDEYIVGTLDITEMDERYISEFYEIWFPHDSDTIEFDWQSSLAGLYISIGGTRPTTKNADFVFNPPGIHTIFSLKKEDILRVAKKKKVISEDTNSIQDINMVIGVWTNKTDSINKELYSLRIHQNINNETQDLGIIELNSDQKVICKPKSFRDGYSTSYRCLFIISVNGDENARNPIFLHAYSSIPAANVYLLANYIEKDVYNKYDIDEIKRLIPTKQNAEYNTYSEDINYIYLHNFNVSRYFFVNLYTDVEADLTLINSVALTNPWDGRIPQVYPNSHTEQIFACQEDQIQLDFPDHEQSISVTIEVISGEAEINWKDNAAIHKVKGSGDRLTLISEKDQKYLMVRNTKYLGNKFKLNAKMEDPGFLFYVTFKERKTGVNFDEIPIRKSTEISYTNTDLPVILYCKLNNIYKDLDISVQFQDISTQTEGQYTESPIIVRSSIMKEDTIYSARKNSETDMVPSKEKSVFGIYDPAIKTAVIHISKAKLDSYNIKKTENPTLYLRLEKSQNYETEVFANFNIETQVSSMGDNTIPVEKVYHYGKLGSLNDTMYILKIQKDKTFMRVHIAFNSPDLDFTINRYNNQQEKNETFDGYRSSRERGKVIITFMPPKINCLYLHIFRKKPAQNVNEQLTNYVFKYISADSETEFFDYTMRSPLINCDIKSSTESKDMRDVSCSFNQISGLGNFNVTYFLKVVDNSTYIYGEEMQTIAVTESPNSVYFVRNPPVGIIGDNDKLFINATGLFTNWGYINVIAQVQQNNIIEYVAYNGKMEIKPNPNKNEKEKEEESSDNTVLFAVIGGVLGAIVIGLVVVIVVIQIKNKSLMNKVKHISFQKTNAVTDPNLLLQKQTDTINSA